MRGIGALAVGELAGERMAVAFESRDQEDEHSCFSDNTNADVVNDIKGILMVYEAEFPGVSGPSLQSLVEARDPELAGELHTEIEEALGKAQAFPATFETMIAAADGSREREAMEDVIDDLEDFGETLGEAADGARGEGRIRGLSVRGDEIVAARLRSLAAALSSRRGWPAATSERAGNPALSGGAGATVFDTTADAFARPVPGLSRADARAFAVGNSFFNRNWVTAPASTTGRDGLGPTFNAQSCSSCHFKDGRAQPPAGGRVPELGLLLRLSVARARRLAAARALLRRPAAGPRDPRRAGRRAHPHHPPPARRALRRRHPVHAARAALRDRRPRVRPLPKGLQISPRVAPGVFGVGLLEAVPERTILGHADPADADRDGISGRANRVGDARSRGTALGRFGWKANVPSVEQQNAGAFQGDIGITSPIFPTRELPARPARVRGRAGRRRSRRSTSTSSRG